MTIPRALDIRGTDKGSAFRRIVRIVPVGMYFVARFEGIRTKEGVAILTDPPDAKRVLRGKRFVFDVGYFSTVPKAYSFVEELAFIVGRERLDHSAMPTMEPQPSHVPWIVDFGRGIEPSSAADAFAVLLGTLESCATDERIREEIVGHQAMAVRVESEGDVPEEDLQIQLEASLKRSMTVPRVITNSVSMSVGLAVDFDKIGAIPASDITAFSEIIAPVAANGPFRLIAHEVLYRGTEGRSYQLIAQLDPAVDANIQEMIDRITDSLVGNGA
jgi:hypothetical protein